MNDPGGMGRVRYGCDGCVVLVCFGFERKSTSHLHICRIQKHVPKKYQP